MVSPSSVSWEMLKSGQLDQPENEGPFVLPRIAVVDRGIEANRSRRFGNAVEDSDQLDRVLKPE